MRTKQSQLASVRSDHALIQLELDNMTENMPRSAWADRDFDRFASLSDRLHTARQQVKRLQHSGDENDYFLRTGDILYKYYDIIDSNKNDAANSDLLHGIRCGAADFNNNARIVFSIDGDSAQITPQRHGSRDPVGPLHSDSLRRRAHARAHRPGGRYYGSVEYILIDHEKPTYKDPPKDAACFAYKRINHLNKWLNQVQGKETTEIPDDVFMNIIMEIKKQKITNMATLTPNRIRAILKKIDSNKYYEHIPHIMHRLNGIPTIHMPPDLEDKVRFMFCAIQIPFLKYQPPKRKNFLSYSYCLHKMMQLLEKDQYLVNFPLLKSREKLYQQDQIWRKICEDVRWDFIPSL
eukprot:gene10902-17022_t